MPVEKTFHGLLFAETGQETMEEPRRRKQKSPGKKIPLRFGLEDEMETKPLAELKAGDLCPKCRKGYLDYDGMLNLTCPECGYSLAGCFT